MNELFPPNLGPPYRNNPTVPALPGNPIRIARARLEENWYSCGMAKATILSWSMRQDGVNAVFSANEVGILVRDPIGLIEWELAALKSPDGEWYLPARMMLTIWQPQDSSDGHWELLRVGEQCKAGSGSGSEPDRERPCELPPCPGSGLFVLMCRNGECATWQPLESE